MNNAKMDVSHMDLFYGDYQALRDINLSFIEHNVTAMIGPSGCGKSTLLKSLNRMNDLVEGCKITGRITLDGEDIYDKYDVNVLRKKVGMVFQKPNPFPMSIYDNIAFGPRTHGIKKKSELDDIVEDSLRKAAIFDELKDRLKKNALGLSGGQIKGKIKHSAYNSLTFIVFSNTNSMKRSIRTIFDTIASQPCSIDLLIGGILRSEK